MQKGNIVEPFVKAYIGCLLELSCLLNTFVNPLTLELLNFIIYLEKTRIFS